jgi:hypothetical protein
MEASLMLSVCWTVQIEGYYLFALKKSFDEQPALKYCSTT